MCKTNFHVTVSTNTAPEFWYSLCLQISRYRPSSHRGRLVVLEEDVGFSFSSCYTTHTYTRAHTCPVCKWRMPAAMYSNSMEMLTVYSSLTFNVPEYLVPINTATHTHMHTQSYIQFVGVLTFPYKAGCFHTN